jgi:hypothetical protein
MPKAVTRSVSANGKAGQKKGTSSGREVIHPSLYSEIFSGDKAITVELAKEMLGLEEVEKGAHTDISRVYGKKVRCVNNVSNRPLDNGNLLKLAQEILRGRWRFNGEPIIIGSTGLILNGQHSLLALILAAQEWENSPEHHPFWTTEPTLEKAVVYGVSEEDAVVNTMDTCKPRSLSDVIIRAHYFKGLKDKGQRTVGKMAEHAIKMLWKRTGVHINALGIKQTHAESIAYLDQHPQLLKAVRHIYEENDDNKIGKYLSPGYASAALFLMGSSSSIAESYYKADNPSDKLLDWSNWDKACEFFVDLAAGSEKLKPIRTVITQLLSQGAGSWHDRWSVLAKAWFLYSAGKPVTTKGISLKFEVKDDVKHMVEEPLFGGIDVGSDGIDHKTVADPDVEQATEKVREKRHGKVRVAKKKGKTWAKGDTAWVHVKGDDPYFAALKDDPYSTSGGIERVFVIADDGEWEVAVMDLSLKQFEMA